MGPLEFLQLRKARLCYSIFSSDLFTPRKIRLGLSAFAILPVCEQPTSLSAGAPYRLAFTHPGGGVRLDGEA